MKQSERMYAEMVFISKDADPDLIEYFKAKGLEICFVSRNADVDEPIENHPDIYMCKLGTDDEDPVYTGDASLLGRKYPSDVKYNAAVAGKYIICCRKHVSKNLLEAAENHILQKYGCRAEIIDVPQGYTKCNLAVLSEKDFITEDEGISRKLTAAGLRCLLLETHEVALPGYRYGFIGGCCGVLGDELVFNGNITKHSGYDKIRSFVEAAGLRVVHTDAVLTDIGSIIYCKNK